MTIPATTNLALIAIGQPETPVPIEAELAWIESRALDGGNPAGDTMTGPLRVPSMVVGGVNFSTNNLFYFGVDTGLVNALVVTNSGIPAPFEGMLLSVKVKNTGTGNAALVLNGGASTPIQTNGGNIPAGSLYANSYVLLEYSGSPIAAWQVVGTIDPYNANGVYSGTNQFSGPLTVSAIAADILGTVAFNGGVKWPFPAGTPMLFFQAAAPPGWTQVTTVNDQVLRVVSGAGGGTGGSWSVSGFAAASHTHDLGAHTHTELGNCTNQTFSSGGGGGCFTGALVNYGVTLTTGPSTNTSGATAPAVTNDGTWRPAYIDVIACSKN